MPGQSTKLISFPETTTHTLPPLGSPPGNAERRGRGNGRVYPSSHDEGGARSVGHTRGGEAALEKRAPERRMGIRLGWLVSVSNRWQKSQLQ